jgi:hypothetical protein
MMTPSSSFLFYLIQYYNTVIPDNKEKLSVLSSFSVRSQCGERTKPFHAFAFYFGGYFWINILHTPPRYFVYHHSFQ